MTSPGLEVKPVVGYSDPMCVAPGEPIRFMVSSSGPSLRAEVVRLRHGDPAPGAPPRRYERVASDIEGEYEAEDQPLRLGSYVEVPHDAALEPVEGLSVQAWIFRRGRGARRRAL